MVVLFYAHAEGYGQGLQFGKNGSAAVPFLFRIVPVLAVAGELQINLAFLQFRLLQTEDVRVQFLKIFQKVFAHAGAQSVYIPRN